MTPALAFFRSGDISLPGQVADALPLRLLPASGVPLASHTPSPQSAHASTDGADVSSGHSLGLVGLALVLHAAVVWGVWSGEDRPRTRVHQQDIELLHPVPEVKPEPSPPPPPPPPPRRVEPPPKAAQPPQATPPPAALRTAPAEAAQPNTMTVAENLTAPPTTGPVVAAPPAPPPPAPPKEEPVTEPNGYAAYLNNPMPEYPRAALRQGLRGKVVLRVFVLASGQVGQIEVKQSSGKPLLDEAGLAAVKAWTFAPAKKGKNPVDAWTQVTFDFQPPA